MREPLTPFPIRLPVLVLIGPTAIGKTDLSLELAQRFRGEIISMDSMQVYRHMDIGTAKATREEQGGIPHHLIDIVDPDEDYDAQRFAGDALRALKEIHGRGKLPIITGGAGLYLKALAEGLSGEIARYPELRDHFRRELEREGASKLHEYLSLCDPFSAKRIHRNDTQRLLRALEIYHGTGIPWSEHLHRQKKNGCAERFRALFQIGLTCARKILYERINLRSSMMMKNGLVDETEKLLQMGYAQDMKPMGAIGYRHALRCIEGAWNTDDAELFLARDTRRYAKRQYTWFSKNRDIRWYDPSQRASIPAVISEWLSSVRKQG